ncbi:MAG: hypothetical protein NC201_05370 [Prevotella sp.]|nr:hypothetical protein [Bacteroides sp.]MCM1366662.1 hypothetical protein [Prevotella sp.]MCM1437329.1 hypothetical protein [Prevotella sp.]
MKKIFLFLLLTATSGIAFAQDLKGNVEVEGSYSPDIIRQERITVSPVPPAIDVASSTLIYDTEGRRAEYSPTLTPMIATPWRASRNVYDNRGYIKAGLGSYLNSNLSAGYRFIDSQETTVGAWLQFNSSTLFHPENKDAVKNPYRRRYDGKAGVYASHLFEGKGRLSAKIDYALDYFNYYASIPSNTDIKAPTQTLNDINFSAEWVSDNASKLKWYAGAEVNYLGYRTFYFPLYNDYREKISGQRETDISLRAGVNVPWENGSNVGLDALFNLLLYSGTDRVSLSDPSYSVPDADNYAQLSLTPYYTFRRDLLNVRLGADVDLTVNAGIPGDRYHFFHIAPDIRFDWRKDVVGFFLHLLGGSELKTLKSLRRADYYAIPAILNTRPCYSPVDASASIVAGPFSGFTASFSIAYKINNHTPLGGWYQMWLSHSNPLFNPAQKIVGGYLSPDNDLTLKGWSFGLNLDYKYGRKIELSAKGTYQHQRNGHGYFNGYDRPRWTVAGSLLVRPIEKLSLEVQYNLRAVRKFYYRLPVEVADKPQTGVINFDPEFPLGRMNVPNSSELSLRAEYFLSEPFSLWLRADNILCRRNVILPGVTSERLAVMGGFSFLF